MALGHLWSLSCEMQFYLLSPVIYLLGGRSTKRRNIVYGLLLFGALLGGLMIVIKQPIECHKYYFQFAIWPMMFGFFCESKIEPLRRFPKLFLVPLFWGPIVICAISLVLMIAGLGKAVVVASGALLLISCLISYITGKTLPGHPGRWMGWLGERTYSIYLWQQPFTLCEFLPSPLHPLGSLVAIVVGSIWFHYFERPFLSSNRRP